MDLTHEQWDVLEPLILDPPRLAGMVLIPTVLEFSLCFSLFSPTSESPDPQTIITLLCLAIFASNLPEVLSGVVRMRNQDHYQGLNHRRVDIRRIPVLVPSRELLAYSPSSR
ncbi:MAG: hypothetical protein JOZ19_05155 [Rubrobacter sp.]|nr:hypothetical protein [Rubrobacter sp.]